MSSKPQFAGQTVVVIGSSGIGPLPTFVLSLDTQLASAKCVAEIPRAKSRWRKGLGKDVLVAQVVSEQEAYRRSWSHGTRDKDGYYEIDCLDREASPAR
jgi:hypothetical protein